MNIPQRTCNGGLVLLVVLGIAPGCSQVPSYSRLSTRDFESFDDANLALVENAGARDESAKSDPDRKQISEISRARQLEKEGPIEASIQEYKRLIAQYPAAPTPYHRLAVLYDRNGQSEKSARHYLTAMHLAPKNVGILCDYGYSRYLQDDLHLAESTLREVIAREPSLQRAHNNLALVFARQGKDEDAVEAFQDGGASLAQARSNLANARKAKKLSLSSNPPTEDPE